MGERGGKRSLFCFFLFLDTHDRIFFFFDDVYNNDPQCKLSDPEL